MADYQTRRTIASMHQGKRCTAISELAELAGVPDGVWPLLKQGLYGAASALLIDEMGASINTIADMIWEG